MNRLLVQCVELATGIEAQLTQDSDTINEAVGGALVEPYRREMADEARLIRQIFSGIIRYSTELDSPK